MTDVQQMIDSVQNGEEVNIDEYFSGLKDKYGVPPAKYLQGQQGLAVRKIESISKRYILCHESRNTITGRTAVKLKLTPKPPQ